MYKIILYFIVVLGWATISTSCNLKNGCSEIVTALQNENDSIKAVNHLLLLEKEALLKSHTTEPRQREHIKAPKMRAPSYNEEETKEAMMKDQEEEIKRDVYKHLDLSKLQNIRGTRPVDSTEN